MSKYIIRYERPSLTQRWDKPYEVRYVMYPAKSKVISTSSEEKAYKFDTRDEAVKYAEENVIATKIDIGEWSDVE